MYSALIKVNTGIQDNIKKIPNSFWSDKGMCSKGGDAESKYTLKHKEELAMKKQQDMRSQIHYR